MMLLTRPNRLRNVSILMLGASAETQGCPPEIRVLHSLSTILPRNVMLLKFALHITFIMRKTVPKLDLFRWASKSSYQISARSTS